MKGPNLNTTVGHARGLRRGQLASRPATPAADRGSPSRDDTATGVCPLCGRCYTPSGRARYCSDGCRKKAWRRRHAQPPAPIVVAPPSRARRPITVYECGACGTRALGEQRCGDCGTFMARVGVGGLCPHCDGAVAVCDLLGEDIAAVSVPGQPESTERRRR